jgi:transposase
MVRRGPTLAELQLSEDERTTLERWARRPKSEQSLALRCKIVLACGEGLSNGEVAERLGVNRTTVGKWRNRFVERRLEGLHDEPRPGVPRKFGDDDIEALVVKTLTDKPKGATHWSTRDMAKATGMSQPTVSRIWRAFGLKPWASDTFKLSEDPLFIEKIRDVVGIYMNPPEHAVVCCVDEKTGIQALDRTQPILPMRPGQVERRTHDYVRNGITDLFAALNVATGEVIATTRRRHRAEEFKAFLMEIDKAVPDNLEVHIVLDNSSTHKTPAIKTWLLRHPRFHFHFTPTSSSWLNLVERWFAELTRKLLQRSAHRSLRALEADLRAWTATWNENPRPFVWRKTADEILESLAGYCQRISDSGH